MFVSVKTVEQLKKVARKISSGSDKKAMTLTTVQSLSSIESFLLPAPISVAILGQLMAIATTIDFSLTKNAPTGGFQYIKHPDSFRACLVQISISGCDAFTTAHKNMDKIGLYCMTFREYVHDLVNMMLKGNEQDKSSLAPIILDDMMQQAKMCLESAQNTESDFNALTSLLSEVCCAATEAKGLHESNLKEAMNRRKILENEKKILEVQKLEIEKEKREVIEQLSKAQQELEEAEGEIPGPMKTILMKTFEKVVNVASTSACLFGLSELTNPVAMTTVVVKGVYDLGIAAIENSGKEETKGDKKSAMKIALINAPEIYSLVTNLVENIKSRICHETKTEEKTISDKQNLQDDNQSKWQNDISCIREQFEKIMKELEESDVSESAAVQTTSYLCKRSITVCVTVTQQKGCKDFFEGLLKEVKSISKEAESLKIKSDMLFSPGATTCLNMPIDSENENKEMFEQVIDNLLIKIESRKQRLEYLRRKQEAVIQKAQEINPQNTKLLEEFLKTDLQKIEFEEIIQTLSKGMEALGNLNKQWRTMVLYFLHITSRIEACMLDKTTHLEKRLHATDISFRAIDYKNKSILEIAAGMDAVAYSVELLAKTYTDISGKHLVGPTAELIGMIALDPKKDADKLNDKRRELNENCTRAQQEIKKLTAESRERALKHIHEQFDRIKIIESEIPGVEEDRKDQIRKNVKESIEHISNIEMDESDYL